MATLYYLPYSPWSEKARWALAHHQVPHERRLYVPMMGELALRMRLGKPGAKATVPVLFDGDAVYPNAWSIVKHAEEVGTGAPLIPRAQRAVIEGWEERAQRMLEVGRALTTIKAARDPQTLVESVPPQMKSLGGLRLPIARLGVHFLRTKYDFVDAREDALRAELADAVAHLDETLGGGRYLLDGFSYADIAMATALAFVSPVDDRYIRLGPASRLSWTEPALAQKHRRLIDWRDALYDAYRRP